MSRGLNWTRALADGPVDAAVPSVITADSRLGDDTARLVTVVPDPGSPYHRARKGEVGLREGLEDRLQAVGGDADAGVVHREPPLVARRPSGRGVRSV